MFRLPWQKKNRLLKGKLDLIDFAFSNHRLESFADLGGVWRVEGGYTFYALDKHRVSRAVLVDTHPTEAVIERSRAYPNLRLLQGNFGNAETALGIGAVDAVFLFDVLLHQVSPNWDEILEMYAAQVRCLVVYNQQWIGSGHTVRLLELGEEEYFRNVPHRRGVQPYADLYKKLDEKHPDHERNWRDVHHIWQWGITDTDLEQVAARLGFKLSQKLNFGRFGRLVNFEDHGFVFTR